MVRLLDLFCGAGGAAMGYSRAGFDEIVGVDNRPMPRYPYTFVQADALEYLQEHGHEFDAIHASPPCQAFCALSHMANAGKYPNLIPQTREALKATGLPYVIENVPGAPLINPVMLCGTMFGLETDCGAQLRRHRLFETNWLLICLLSCGHHPRSRGRSISVTGTGDPVGGRTISVHGTHARDPWLTKNRGRTITVTGSTAQQNVVRNCEREVFPVAAAQKAMGIDWCGMKGLSQAIPPAYTEYIGRQLLLEVLR
jgi:DNA (cytosine-5)-methyltransferase 1